MRARRFIVKRLAPAVALAALLCQCETARFYSQAVAGHWQIQRAAKPSQRVRADATAPESVRAKLEVVEELRRFAGERLGLPARGQYHRYADLKREHLVWVVFAAPEFSLEARTWRYPLLGRLSYRGYFQQKDAEALAERLRAAGDDVFVAEVDAYSTLGWFSDPVLNTFIGLPERDLAELLFHELTHQRIYLRGDTDFNEALATAAGRAGARLWLRESGRKSELAKFERDEQVVAAFLSELTQTRAELKALYARTDLEPEAMRQAKAAIFAGLRRRADALNHRHGGSLKIDRWFQKPVNNARLLSIAAYYDMVPLFERHLERTCGGDFEAFFQSLKPLRRLSPEQRRRWLMNGACVKAKDGSGWPEAPAGAQPPAATHESFP